MADMEKLTIGQLFEKLTPKFKGLIKSVGGGNGPFAPTPHGLDSGHHTGTLQDAQAPQFLKTDGSRELTHDLTVAEGKKVDGVDISALDLDVQNHKNGTAAAAHNGIGSHNHQSEAEGGVLNHNQLQNLTSGDPHTQYFNQSRHTLNAHLTIGLVPQTRLIQAGSGLSGGGDLSGDRMLSIGAGAGISVLEDSLAVDQSFSPVWTGNHAFQGSLSTRHIIPEQTDTYDLGSSSKLWRKGWLSELDSVLFAQNTQTLLGGSFVIGKGQGSLPSELATAATTYDFGQIMTPGYFLILRSSLQVEYIQIGTLVSGTEYNLTRNLDGSGANDWPAGSVYLVLGSSGDGRIELNAADTPKIQLIQQGANYNDQTELIRIGDLNGNWGSTSPSLGIAIGQYAPNKGNVIIKDGDLKFNVYTDEILNIGSGAYGNAAYLNGTLRIATDGKVEAPDFVLWEDGITLDSLHHDVTGKYPVLSFVRGKLGRDDASYNSVQKTTFIGSEFGLDIESNGLNLFDQTVKLTAKTNLISAGLEMLAKKSSAESELKIFADYSTNTSYLLLNKYGLSLVTPFSVTVDADLVVTDTLRIPGGSAGVPSLIFSATQQNDGLYHDGEGIAISTDGSRRIGFHSDIVLYDALNAGNQGIYEINYLRFNERSHLGNVSENPYLYAYSDNNLYYQCDDGKFMVNSVSQIWVSGLEGKILGGAYIEEPYYGCGANAVIFPSNVVSYIDFQIPYPKEWKGKNLTIEVYYSTNSTSGSAGGTLQPGIISPDFDGAARQYNLNLGGDFYAQSTANRANKYTATATYSGYGSYLDNAILTLRVIRWQNTGLDKVAIWGVRVTPVL